MNPKDLGFRALVAQIRVPVALVGYFIRNQEPKKRVKGTVGLPRGASGPESLHLNPGFRL